MVDNSNTLIDAIKELQSQQGLNDVELASILGIGQSTWSRIKSKERLPGVRFLNSVLKIYPSLRALVFDYISTRNNHDS